jgi:ATP-dependent DNA helicase RecQ
MLSGVRALLERAERVEASAATVARWCGRRANATFPSDLLKNLQALSPSWDVALVVTDARPIVAATRIAFSRAPSFVPDPLLDRFAGGGGAAVAPDELLKRYTDFPGYRSPEQHQLVHAMLDPQDGRDILGVLPTGGGKSLSFLLPTLERTSGGGTGGLTIVISPILALMNDQVTQVRRRYRMKSPTLSVEQLNSTVSEEDRRRVYRDLEAGRVHVLYLSPETIHRPRFLAALFRSPVPINYFVVDEVHMIREWGEDFRCDFQRLGALRDELRDRFKGLRTLLLTATLTPDARAAVLSAMRVEPASCRTIERRVLREELHHQVVSFDRGISKVPTLLERLRRLPRPGIIYCTRKETCEELASAIDVEGFASTRIYNGDTPTDARQQILQQFQDGLVDLIIATNAFGLGVDKPDVRFVLHYQVPESLDRYYQEIGRAGRDGRAARAILFYSGQDMGVAHRQAVSRLNSAYIVGRLQSMWRTKTALATWRGRAGRFFVLNDRIVPTYALGTSLSAESDGPTDTIAPGTT